MWLFGKKRRIEAPAHRAQRREAIILYGASWCGDCRRARRVFESVGVDYVYIDIDLDKEAEQYVFEINQGMRIMPTITFPDDTILAEPRDDILLKKLREFKP
jgi:mycoredoxin